MWHRCSDGMEGHEGSPERTSCNEPEHHELLGPPATFRSSS